jgi:two-component system cell cycle response regulator
MSVRVRSVARILLLFALGLLIAVVAHVATNAGAAAWDAAVQRWIYTLILLLCSSVCLLRAASRSPQRVAWALVAVGLALWSAGSIRVWALDDVWQLTAARMWLPEALWICLYPLAYVAIGLMARERLRGVGAGLWLDGVGLALALGALANELLIAHIVRRTPGANATTAVPALVFALGDAVLVTMIAGTVTLLGWRVGKTWGLLAAGFAMFAVADAIYTAQMAAGTYAAGTAVDIGWLAGAFLIAAAAMSHDHAPARPRDVTGTATIAVPIVTGAGLVAILTNGALSDDNTALVALAGLGLSAVVARMALTLVHNRRLLRSSREEAATDALTMLGNRRRLILDLEEALTQDDGGPSALALFDLDGFKGYNDAFGHPAGDALLARIARALQQALGERGVAYRLGGDEFCALFHAQHESDAHATLGRLVTAMRQRGEGFEVSASAGIAWLGSGTDPSAALGLADRRMYAAKQHATRGPRRQTADALVAAGHARHPQLAGDDDIAALAVSVARRLNVPDHAIADIREATRLRDIGKIAIPDAVLDKPAPLDAQDWDFMHRHTIIGERILASAPALYGVGEIIRSSHERWDGAGYPDGRKGADIPLGARIVLACDAYWAMTNDRPYQAARLPHEAIAEIRDCAGRQFDPVVVEALAGAVSAADRPDATRHAA